MTTLDQIHRHRLTLEKLDMLLNHVDTPQKLQNLVTNSTAATFLGPEMGLESYLIGSLLVNTILIDYAERAKTTPLPEMLKIIRDGMAVTRKTLAKQLDEALIRNSKKGLPDG